MLTTDKTLYKQGTSLTAIQNPEFGYKEYINFSVNYSNSISGTPIADGICSVLSNNYTLVCSTHSKNMEMQHSQHLAHHPPIHQIPIQPKHQYTYLLT